MAILELVVAGVVGGFGTICLDKDLVASLVVDAPVLGNLRYDGAVVVDGLLCVLVLGPRAHGAFGVVELGSEGHLDPVVAQALGIIDRDLEILALDRCVCLDRIAIGVHGPVCLVVVGRAHVGNLDLDALRKVYVTDEFVVDLHLVGIAGNECEDVVGEGGVERIEVGVNVLVHILLDGRLGILDQEDRLALGIRGRLAGRRHLAGLIDGELDVGRDVVALGGDGLAQGVFRTRREAFDELGLGGGGPLKTLAGGSGYDFALAVEHLNRGSLEFLPVGDVGLGDLDRSKSVLDEERVSFHGLTLDDYVTVLIKGEGNLGGNGVTSRRDSLAQGVLDTGLETSNSLRRIAGRPGELFARSGLCDLVFVVLILDENLELSTGQLFAASNSRLGNGESGRGILDENDAVLLLCAGNGYLAIGIDGKGDSGCNLVAVGRDGLGHGVELARLETPDDVDGLVLFRLRVVNGRNPAVCNRSLRVGYDNRCTRELDIVRDIHLGDLDFGSRVLHQQDGVAIPVGRVGALGSHLAILVDRKGGIGGDGVAVRSYDLMQGVGTSFKTLDDVRLRGGSPLRLVAVNVLSHLVILIQNLNLGTWNLCATINIYLGDTDSGERVLDEEHAPLSDGAGRGNLSALVDGELGFGSNRVAVGGDGLAQRVLLAGLEALDDVRLVGGGPLLDDLALGVDDLDLGTLKLLAVGDVGL